MNIGFIGAGAMAEALIKGLVGSGAFEPDAVSCSDISTDRLQYLKEN